MSAGPQACLLPDAKRLHLHHGPIDLIIEVWGPERAACYDAAIGRFDTILGGLVSDLSQLRQPLQDAAGLSDLVSRRMANAVAPYQERFVTPMAAVAGAVADEVLATMVRGRFVPKAYVNNGGDIAFHLTAGHSFASQGAAGRINIGAQDRARGVATSGWQGRSHSLGIADAVTVVARCAADADVAATLIANAVDLPGDPVIGRAPACDLAPDSDLGGRLVTVHVPDLSQPDKNRALDRGCAAASDLCRRGLIEGATLLLQGQCRSVQNTKDTAEQENAIHV